MTDLIFSANAVLPLFFVIYLGYFAKKRKMFGDETISQINHFSFRIALPVMLFLDLASADFNEMFDPKLLIYAVATTLLSVTIIIIFALFFVKKKESLGAFIQGAFRGNYAIVGLTLVNNIAGDSAAVKGALLIAVVVPLYNVLATTILTLTNTQNKNLRPSGLLKEIIKNPLIIGVLLAIPFSFFDIDLPIMVQRSLSLVKNIAAPLALIAIGGSISIPQMKSNFTLSFTASLFKLIIIPLIFIPVAIHMGFGSAEIVILFVMYSTPAAISSYPMAYSMNGDHALASNIIIVTVFFSMFTMTAGLYLLKAFGAI